MDKDDIKAANLLTPEEGYHLMNNMQPRPIVIQVSKKDIYEKAHLPSALNLWRPDYAADEIAPVRGLAASPDKLEGLLQKLGYETGKTLFLYDAKANVDALRFAWVLQLYGFSDFKIINGGMANWKQTGLPISTERVEEPHPSNYKLAAVLNENILAKIEDVKAAITDDNILLVDTRETYEYKGEPFIHRAKVHPYKKGASTRGSIPGAIHLNWSTFADLHQDHRIKSEHDLRYDLKLKGITPNKEIILYCHSGSRTSHTLYVLKEILGFGNVKNYDGSWIEWSHYHNQDTTLPIAQLCKQEHFDLLKDSLTTSLAINEVH